MAIVKLNRKCGTILFLFFLTSDYNWLDERKIKNESSLNYLHWKGISRGDTQYFTILRKVENIFLS